MTKVEYLKKLQHLLDMEAKYFFKKNEAFYVNPEELPENKIKNAIKTYASEATLEDVVGIGDTTFLGSGKEGLLFTSDSLYIKMSFSNRIAGKYCEFSGYYDSYDDEYIITSPTPYKLSSNHINCEEFEKLIKKIQKLYQEYREGTN